MFEVKELYWLIMMVLGWIPLFAAVGLFVGDEERFEELHRIMDNKMVDKSWSDFCNDVGMYDFADKVYIPIDTNEKYYRWH